MRVRVDEEGDGDFHRDIDTEAVGAMSNETGGNQGLCLCGTDEDGLVFGEQLGVVDHVGLAISNSKKRDGDLSSSLVLWSSTARHIW